MNVILLSPNFPAEMPLFTRGLARIGARVFGVGEQPVADLPAESREALADYLQVKSLWEEDDVLHRVHGWVRGTSIDRVECLWEPGMILAARMRGAFGVPGMSLEQTMPFRDKELMKRVLDQAGVRTPRHARARSADEVRQAAEHIGYPLIIKPIAGAGSRDTYRLDEASQLEPVIGSIRHVPEVSVEEYIDGEEFTYDTVCVDGSIAFHNIAWYRPKPMYMAQDWLSPQSICLRDTDIPAIRVGRDLGERVLEALGFATGFTHMEWFRTPDGEAVFGEIAARPAGARLVHAMNYACDTDLFTGWAEATCHGRFTQNSEHVFNAGMVFKRAQGHGRIQRIDGLHGLLSRYGEHVVHIDLPPVGTPKRDPKSIVVGDGFLIVRHPSLEFTVEMTDRIGTDLRLYAG